VLARIRAMHELSYTCFPAEVSKGRKQLELALRCLERAAVLARRPTPRQISLTGHVYLAKVDEREQLSSKTTTSGNLQILVHKG
jgi:hypothetical protein